MRYGISPERRQVLEKARVKHGERHGMTNAEMADAYRADQVRELAARASMIDDPGSFDGMVRIGDRLRDLLNIADKTEAASHLSAAILTCIERLEAAAGHGASRPCFSHTYGRTGTTCTTCNANIEECSEADHVKTLEHVRATLEIIRELNGAEDTRNLVNGARTEAGIRRMIAEGPEIIAAYLRLE
jgi:hypothetical protein